MRTTTTQLQSVVFAVAVSSLILISYTAQSFGNNYLPLLKPRCEFNRIRHYKNDPAGSHWKRSDKSKMAGRSDQDRRAFMSVITTTSLFNFFESFFRPSSSSSSAQALNNADFVTVIGANGRTGSNCVQVCLNKAIPVRAATRTGQLSETIPSSPLLSSVRCKVKDPLSMNAADILCYE